MAYLVYFTDSQAARRMRSEAGSAGWRATVFAVPGAFVARLTRRRLIRDGRIDAEREQVIHLSSTYGGDWRYVLVEQPGVDQWDELAARVKQQSLPARQEVPAQRRAIDIELRAGQGGDG